MYRLLGAALLIGIVACDRAAPKGASRAAGAATPTPPTQVATPAAPVRWPSDQSAYQLANLDSLKLDVPVCGNVLVAFGLTAVGPLRPGQSLAEVRSHCPRTLPIWDWGDEGIPTPVMLVRFGAMTVRITFDDTLPESRVSSLLSSDSTARTLEGVGPGSSVALLQQAYGKPTYAEGECAVFATFPRQPGMSFRLDLLKHFECGTLEGDGTSHWAAPPTTKVREVFIYSREPAV